ncbi:MAG: hypothetical protein ACXWC9_01460, partial [Pseudobdellovibrionaceae bacterium]
MIQKFIVAVLILSSNIATAEIVDRVLSVVNTEIVLLSDLKSFSKKIEQGSMIDDLLLFGQRADALKGNRQLQTDYLINEKLLDSEIKRL